MNGSNEFEHTKKQLKKWKWQKLKYLMVCLIGKRRVAYLKKHNIFGYLGENVLFQP